EHDMTADEFAEVTDAAAEQHRHQTHADLVDQPEIHRLLSDVSAGDGHELVTRHVPRGGDRFADAACERSSGKAVGSIVRRRSVGDHDYRGTCGVVIAPA